MRDIRAHECLRILTAVGYVVRGVTPIRFVLSRGDSTLVFVPRHGPISVSELRRILAAANVEETDFERLRCEGRGSRPSGFESVAPRDGAPAAAGLLTRLGRALGALGTKRSDARAS
jgi:hypothetical protein